MFNDGARQYHAADLANRSYDQRSSNKPYLSKPHNREDRLFNMTSANPNMFRTQYFSK